MEAGDYITIVLHEDWQVPDGGISVSDVTIDGNVSAEDTNGVVRRVADARPALVTVDDGSIFDTTDNDAKDWSIQIEIGDMAVGSEFPGLQGIDSQAEVTVTIAAAAGIRAPSKAGGYDVALALSLIHI